MTNTERIKNIGLSLDEITKFLNQNDVQLDIDKLSEIEFFNIIHRYIEAKKEQVIKLRNDLREEKQDWKNNIEEQQKEEWLKFNEKLEEEEKKLQQQKIDLEQELKNKRNNFLQKLQQEEIEHKAKLAKEKDDFLKKAKEEFESYIQNKQKELAQKEQELENKEIEINNKKELLEQKEKTFDEQKQRELNSLQEQLNEKEIQFEYSLKEKELKLIDEAKEKADKLYKEREEALSKKEQDLNNLNIELQALRSEIAIKEREISFEKNNISNKVDELIKSKINSYEKTIELLEDEVERLREEKDEYFSELNDYKDNQDRELLLELSEKKEELKSLKTKIESIKEEKNSQIEKNEILIKDLQENLISLENENKSFRIQIESVERLNSKIRIKNEQLKEIDLLKGENEHLRKKLESIYSTDQEKEKRVKDIENSPYKIETLDKKLDIKDEVEYLNNIDRYMKEYGVQYPKRLLYAFHTALKSTDYSPLTVLSGVSGTGKSELPKLYSYFGGFNFLAEAVQPTWDSSESMIGFYNMMDNKFDATNILRFLIQTSKSHIDDHYQYGLKESMNMILLDEMNLAHIELYFAEFLSKFELRRGSPNVMLDIKLGTGAKMNYQIPLDTNLLWVGTINEDETTKSLSDKVLDRAFSINFPRPEKLLSRGKLKKLDEIKEFEYLDRKIWNSWIQRESIFTEDKKEIINRYRNIADEINAKLKTTGRAIGHRVWQSIEFYINNHPEVIHNKNDLDMLDKKTKTAFEEQLVQKIIPKLRGIETHDKEKDVLVSIKDILNQNEFTITEDFELAMDNPYGQFIWSSANYLKEE